MGQQEASPCFSSSVEHEHLHGNSHQRSPRQPAMVRIVAYLDRKAMSSGCYTCFFSMWRFHVWGQSRLRPSFILFKNCFQIHSGSVQAARRNHRSDQPAQWARRGKPGEEDDDPPPPPSSLTGSTKHHLLYPQRAHTHNFQFSWEHVDTHTHFTLSHYSQMYLFPQTELKIQTTPLSPPASRLFDRPSRLFSPFARPLIWSTQVQNPRLLSSIFQIKLTQKQMTNMVQMFHFITFVKQDKNKYK